MAKRKYVTVFVIAGLVQLLIGVLLVGATVFLQSDLARSEVVADDIPMYPETLTVGLNSFPSFAVDMRSLMEYADYYYTGFITWYVDGSKYGFQQSPSSLYDWSNSFNTTELGVGTYEITAEFIIYVVANGGLSELRFSTVTSILTVTSNGPVPTPTPTPTESPYPTPTPSSSPSPSTSPSPTPSGSPSSSPSPTSSPPPRNQIEQALQIALGVLLSFSGVVTLLVSRRF